MAEATGGSQELEGRWIFVVVDVEEISPYLVVAIQGQSLQCHEVIPNLFNPALCCLHSINREPEFDDG
jgi:hypothetical protein